MGRSSLIYSFVARGTVVLAEFTLFMGNVSTIAVQCLPNLPQNQSRCVYTSDGYTFNYLTQDGFTYLVVADEDLGLQVPFAFLDRVKKDLNRPRYQGGRAEGAIAHSLDREFGPKLRDHMAYCVEQPEEMVVVLRIKGQLSKVNGIITESIERVLDRDEKVKVLVERFDLRIQAAEFREAASEWRRKMWLQTLLTQH